MLLGIIAKPLRRDKFEVTSDSVAYLTGKLTEGVNHTYFALAPRLGTIFELYLRLFLHCHNFLYIAALVAVSEEVRSRCHVKHTLPRWPVESNANEINESTNLQASNVSFFKS